MKHRNPWDGVLDGVHRSHQNLTGRLSRGFQAISQQVAEGAKTPKDAPPLGGHAQEALTQVFKQQQAALQQTLETTLPNELAQTLRLLRGTVRALVGIAILTALVLIGLSWYGQRALLDRTPTASQIELMLRGWDRVQGKEDRP